jgi:hypothetical protein
LFVWWHQPAVQALNVYEVGVWVRGAWVSFAATTACAYGRFTERHVCLCANTAAMQMPVLQ